MKKTLTVGVDIRDLKIAKTGTRTYLEEICRAFKKLNNQQGVRFVFLDTKRGVYTGKNKVRKSIEHLRYFFWKQIQLPLKAKRNQCDVLFCTDFFVPYFSLGIKCIPVFHDAFFWEYPKHYNKYWLALFHTLGVSAAKKSYCIVAPSAYAKKQILQYLPVPESKIKVIHEAPKTLNKADSKNPPASSKAIKTKKFILHIGTFEKRKNLKRLVEAFNEILTKGHKDYSLVLIGQASPKTGMDDSEKIIKFIEKRNLGSYIILTGYVPDEELSWYYQNADFYVFPSFNEGFGLPVLEAFSHDLPVLIANNTCLPEIAGNGALSFDPYCLGSLIEKMEELIESPPLRQELLSHARVQLNRYSWEKTALQLLVLFKSSKDEPKLV